jgi:phage terminase small subunit
MSNRIKPKQASQRIRPQSQALAPIKPPIFTAEEKKHRFVLLYFKKPNGMEAAKAAGYSGTEDSLITTASRLLADAKVQAQLQAMRDRLQERTGITVDKLMHELGKMAFSNIRTFMRPGTNEIDLTQDISEEDWACVSEVITETYMDGGGPSAREVKRVKIKLYDKLTAIEKAGKHLGMFDKRRGGDADDDGDQPQQRIYSLKIGNANILVQQSAAQEANPDHLPKTLAIP